MRNGEVGKQKKQQILTLKTIQFIETLCKSDTVVGDIKQQISIFHCNCEKFFHNYKISNFTIANSQRTLLTMCNGEAGNYVTVKKLPSQFYISNHS